MLARTAALTLLLAVIAACAGTEATGGGAAPNCGALPPPGFHQATLRHDGRDREYRVFLPAGSAEDWAGLLVALHGGEGTAAFFEQQAGLARHAGPAGVVVVYPEAIGGNFNAGRCCGEAARDDIDDVGFVTAVVAGIETDLCRRFERVYGTGFSNGAMLLHRLACERPEMFDAIASVAGTAMVDPCPDARPVAALLIRGRDDARVPWRDHRLGEVELPGLASMAARMARRNRCDLAGSGGLANGNGAVCSAYTGCAVAAPVRFCALHDVGHQWPGGDRLLGGTDTGGFAATAEIFAFFDAVGSSRARVGRHD